MFNYLMSMPLRYLAAHARIGLPNSTWGEFAVVSANLTLGWGEEEKNNAGVDLDTLRRCRHKNHAWCAAAASYWIEEGYAQLNFSKPWKALSRKEREECPIKRSHGARRLWRRVSKAGKIVDVPLPGDLVLWERGQGWQGHIGIVSEVGRDGDFWSFEGNKGRYPSKVRAYHHEIGEPGLIGFARLP